MKQILFCLTFILIISAGFADAQPPGNTFIKLGTVTPTVGIDSITAGTMVSFPIIYGNRDTVSYNLSNGFIIYSDADGVPGDGTPGSRGTGTATWAHATGDGGNYRGFNPDVFGLWIDTTGFYHAGLFTDFATLFKFSCFGCNGAGTDTLTFAAAGGLDGDGNPTRAARKLDSGVFFTIKILTKLADHGKFICIDSSTNYPPTNSWKWPSFNLDTAAHVPPYDNFPTWSGAKCFKVVDPNVPTNQAPVLSPIGNQNLNEGQSLVIIANATDPDLTIPSISASPLPTGASFVDNSNGSAQLSWTPGFNQAGVYNVTFVASDGTLADTETVQITVNNVNRPPVLTPIGPQTVAEGANLLFGISATDPDGGPLTYGASPLPAGATFNPTSAEFNWTPGFDQAGSYDVVFTVSDGSIADSETVTITVNNTNRAPVLAAIGPRSVSVGDVLNFGVSATDPDGTFPGLSASALANATFTDNGNGTGNFSFTPVAGQVGVVGVTFTASDGSLSDEEIVEITVSGAANQAPILTPIGSQSVAEGANLNFVVSATDPDGNPLTFSAAPLPIGATFNSGTKTFDWTPGYEQSGNYNVLFVVSDGSLADSEIVAIEVTNTNRPPVLAAIGSKSVMVGETLNFGVSASDPDGTIPALTASSLTNAALTDNGNGTGSFSFTPAVDQIGDRIVTFTASDGSLTDDEVVTITVTPKTNFLVVTPGTLNFVATFGTNPPVDSFKVEKGGDTEIDFSATKVATWIGLANASGTTPAYVGVNINVLGLAVGDYKDSVKVSGTDVGDKYVVVTLKINPCPVIQLSKTAYYDTVLVGEFAGASDSINVTSTGSPLNWSVAPSTGFTFPTTSGTTPDNVLFTFNEQFNSAGSFQRCFTVAGSSFIPEDPCTSQVQVCVNIVVNERPCVSILTSDSLLSFTAVQGDSIAFPFGRSFQVTSSDPARNFAFSAKAPIGNDWVHFDTTGGTDPFSGTTPTQVPVQVRPGSLGIGSHYVDIIVSTLDPEVCVPQLKVLTVFVNVTRRASADTVLVENKPAVPGQTVSVPVNFVNSCPLKSAGLSLKFDASALHLTAVTYGGSRFEYVTDKQAVIDNDSGTVALMADVGGQALVPDGFGNWATLVFVVRPEATLGVYPIELTDCPDDGYCTNPLFVRNCGENTENQIPEFVPGGIVVDQRANSVCGYVVDPDGVEIPGATVQLWGDFPNGSPEMTTTSSAIGSFFFEGVTSVPFDLYAFANGFYPNKAENLNFNAKGIKIVLSPLGTLTPTSEWVDYYCNENLYLNAPLPVGSVVEAYTPADLLVGRFVVTTAGSYGFMPVYRANSEFGDDGANTGENISFFINGVQALASGNTTYPADYQQVQVCLQFGATIIKECVLQEGWNLVSWPIQTNSKDILAVLGPYMNCIDVVLGFEQGGLTYDPTLTEFSTLWDVDHLSGYWIKVKQGCPVTLEIEGLPVPMSMPIPVTTGWNLVSYLPEWNLTPGYALQSIYDKLLFAYGWENGIQIFKPGSEFNTLTSMKPCNGYWVKITGDDTLIYPDQDVVAGWMESRAVASVQSLSSGGYVTPTWVNLYASDLKLDGRAVEAGSVIEAYSVTTKAKIGSFTLKSDGKFGFMPVYADADDMNAGLRPGGDFYLTVNGTKTAETLTWTSNGDRIVVASLSSGNSSGTLPDGFSLEQNYPNPFNPTTTIRFTVPVNTRARIEIYNLLGALIAVPFDEAVVAGEHNVVWDGRNLNGETVSSGVYLYKLVSDGYSEARKMMLLK